MTPREPPQPTPSPTGPAPLDILPSHVAGKRPFNVMAFAAAAPRSVEEIEAHLAEVAAGRNEWDQAPAAEPQ